MLDLLRLTRPLNLLIIALTMIAIRYGVVAGNLERGLHYLLQEIGDTASRADLVLPPGYGPQMPFGLFAGLVLSTVLIAAGGNIINDYFDTRIDRINKPGKVIVGRSVKRRVAMTGHAVLSGLGLLIGAYVAWRCDLLQWIWIPAFAVGALWTYSTSLKRTFLLGNGLVATLSALVPLTVGVYEIPMLARYYAEPKVITALGDQYIMEPSFFRELWYWVFAYAAFAFMSTLVRELQKDMADVKGDLAAGCRTIPIVWGIKWAKAMALFHIAVIILGLLIVRSLFLHDPISFWYIGIGVIAPLLFSAGFTYNAISRQEHVRAGSLMKVAMVMAVVYSFVIRYLL